MCSEIKIKHGAAFTGIVTLDRKHHTMATDAAMGDL